jgi:hypothetical protein
MLFLDPLDLAASHALVDLAWPVLRVLAMA